MLKKIKKKVYWILFSIFILIGYFLIPSNVWISFPELTVIFILIFAASMTCFIKKIGEVFSLITKVEHLWLAVSSILGIGILPACSIVCSGLNLGLLSAFNLFFASILPPQYAFYSIVFITISQIIIMLNIGCLKSQKLEDVAKKIKKYLKMDKETKKSK